MTSNLILGSALAEAQRADGSGARPTRALAAEPFWAPIVVRIATAGDRASLERLAALDSAERPAGPTLIGTLMQQPVAALSLSDGTVIADPFVDTRDIVELLRLRARQLGAPARGRSLRRLTRRT